MDKDKIQEQIDEANRVAEQIKELLIALQSELAKAEKPELRHGDYGTCRGGGLRTVRLFAREGNSIKCTCGPDDTYPASPDFLSRYAILGNIFDDLKARQEPLEAFMTDVHCYRIDMEDYPTVPISMAGNHHSIAEVKEHILKLQRLVYTAEKK